jgi:hypothetical protein
MVGSGSDGKQEQRHIYCHRKLSCMSAVDVAATPKDRSQRKASIRIRVVLYLAKRPNEKELLHKLRSM